MPMSLAVTGLTETSVKFGFYDGAVDGTVDVQIASRPDFAFCVCPVLNVARSAETTFSHLNQRATLYARCRARRASGATEPWSNIVGFRTGDGAARVTAAQAVMIEPAIIVVPEKVLNWTAHAQEAG